MIILDFLRFETNNPSKLSLYELYYDDNFNEELTRRNDTHKAYADLYRTGELEKLTYHTCTKTFKEKDGTDYTIVYFVLDSDKIPIATKKRIAKLYAHQKITELDTKRYSPCQYTNCVTLFAGGMSTYRDNAGCISRSWESPLVQYYPMSDCSDFAEIRDTKGPEEAGKTVIERRFNPHYGI